MLLRYLLQQLLLYQQVDFTLLDLYDSTIILKLTFHFVVWLHFLVVVYMGPEGFLCAALGTCVSDNWKVVIGALLPTSLDWATFPKPVGWTRKLPRRCARVYHLPTLNKIELPNQLCVHTVFVNPIPIFVRQYAR